MPLGEGDITLFDGGRGGYGWATDIGAHGYHWAINMDMRNGRADLVAGFVTTPLVLQVRPASFSTGKTTMASPKCSSGTEFPTTPR